MSRLPWDISRCQGIISTGTFEGAKICEIEDTCRRYLERKDIGPRTPFLIITQTQEHGCSEYIEKLPETPDQ